MKDLIADAALIAGAAILRALWLAPLFRDPFHRLRHIRLNLRITGICKDRYMSAIGDKFIASIAPTNAEGAPAPVTQVVFTSSTGSYTVAVNPDGTATYTAAAAGSANAMVAATSAAGVALSQAVALPVVVVADTEATALNLTVVPSP